MTLKDLLASGHLKESDCGSVQENKNILPHTVVESNNNNAGFSEKSQEQEQRWMAWVNAMGKRVQRGARWSDQKSPLK